MRKQLLCSCGEFRRMVLEDEMSFKEMANRFGVSYGTIQRYTKQYLSDEERKAVAARSHRETGTRFGGTCGGGHVVIERDDAPNFFQRL